MVLSGRLVRSCQVERFGANMDHGSGRDQVGAVVVRSLEHRSRTREARTPSDQSLRERSFRFLYAYFLPLLGRDWTLALRTVLWVERAVGKVERRSLSVVIHCLQDLFMLGVFVPDPGQAVPTRHVVGELDLLGLFGSELGDSFWFGASSHHVL